MQFRTAMPRNAARLGTILNFQAALRNGRHTRRKVITTSMGSTSDRLLKESEVGVGFSEVASESRMGYCRGNVPTICPGFGYGFGRWIQESRNGVSAEWCQGRVPELASRMLAMTCRTETKRRVTGVDGSDHPARRRCAPASPTGVCWGSARLGARKRHRACELTSEPEDGWESWCFGPSRTIGSERRSW